MIMTDDMYEGRVRDNNTIQRFAAASWINERETSSFPVTSHAERQSDRATPALLDRERDRVYEALPPSEAGLYTVSVVSTSVPVVLEAVTRTGTLHRCRSRFVLYAYSFTRFVK